MGFRVTENWSNTFAGLTVQDGKNASTGVRIFMVTATGATVLTRENCTAATDDVSGLTIPLINQPYSILRQDLRCQNVAPPFVNMGVATVTCNYAVGQFTPPSPDPLDEPMSISIETREIEEEIDHDLDKLPIVNLCKDPLPGGKGTFHVDVWRITKNLAAYDFALARQYRNTVNDNDFTIGGVTIPKGYARCASILPAKEFHFTDEYVPNVLTLEIYDANQWANPHQMRLINQGSQAYAHKGGGSAAKGRICLKNSGEYPANDVLLDINGKPENTTAYATRQQHGEEYTDTFDTSPDAAGIVSSMTIPPDTSISGVVYLIYRRCKESDFDTLITALNMA